jgi:hypothetical protein
MRYGALQYPISLQTPPLDSLILGTVNYSPDLKTFSLAITHTANTDFVWAVIGARSNTGQPLSQPYLLNYTTAATIGVRSVNGTITFEQDDPANAIVALADHALFGEEESTILCGAVVPNSSGSYTVNYVRNGVYWPMVIKDANGDGEYNPMETDPIGFYDPDQDEIPDSIMVSGSNLTGIDMVLRWLFVPARITARAYLNSAITIAQQYYPDQELRRVGSHADPQGIDVGLDGTALMWYYLFYSPSSQYRTDIIASSNFVMVKTEFVGQQPTPKPIPKNFIDSDVAMAIADANGGHDFDAQHQIVRRTLSGGNIWWFDYWPDSTKLLWVAEYEAREPDSSSFIFRVFVDMITGELITAVQEPESYIAPTYSLSQNYPNPFNPSTRIKYQLAKSSHVKFTIYNLTGQEIATLINGFQSAGEHELTWQPKGLPSGLYFYKIQAGDFSETKKLILQK